MTSFAELALSSLFFLGHRPGRPSLPIIYPEAKGLRPHLAYYGTTQSGKTFGMEYALQQVAQERQAGFILIDPHATSYYRMASFLRQHDITDRVLFWDINDPEYVTTYNPFEGCAPEGNHPASYIAGELTAAMLATLGRDMDVHEQAHLKTMTEDGLASLLELGLPFLLAYDLFDPTDYRIKDLIGRALSRSNLVTTVAQIPKVTERQQQLLPSFRRFKNLFADERLKLTFSHDGVNFQQLMDEKWIVLVNAHPGTQHPDNAALFTRLLVKQLFNAAKQRDTGSDLAPFFLSLDEAARFITKDTARILAETAKFGLHLILGMQSAEQARFESEETYIAIRTCMNAEVVMHLNDYDEARYFAQRFYGPHANLKTIKHDQVRINAIPRTVEHVLTSHAHIQGAPTTVEGGGTAYSVVTPGNPDAYGSTTETSNSSSSTIYPGGTDVYTETPGFHTEFDYITEHIPTFYSIDELELMAAKHFMTRPPGRESRFGVARVNVNKPSAIEIPLLPDPLYSPDEMAEWLRDFRRTQPATLPLIEARARASQIQKVKIAALEERTRRLKPPRPRTAGMKNYEF